MQKVEIHKGDMSIEAEEVLERKVKPFGTGGAHILCPKKWLNHKVFVVIGKLLRGGD